MKATNNAYLLAIDQGTTGSRAFIFDAQGHVVASAYQEFKQYFPCPSWVEHDALEIWASVENVIRKATKGLDARRIKAIGITNQRETTLVWDKVTGKPLHKAIVWQDRRTSDLCASPALTKHKAYIAQTTGLTLDPYFCATKIHWLLKNVSSVAQKAKLNQACFGTIDSWLIYKLTGGQSHATDFTNASRTLLFNIREKKWDARLLKIFNIPQSMLPKVLNSGNTFGFTATVAGLPSGIPICAVMGDQQAALYGQGCFKPGTIKNTYGTGCFMMLNLGGKWRLSHKGLLTTIACDVSGKPVYAFEGAVFIAGAVVQWLRDGLKVIKKSSETEAHMLKTKDNGGVYFVPAFVGLGAPYWNPNARGLITGLTRGSTVSHIVRAAVESMAYQTKDVFDVMLKEAALPIKAINVDGGACANDYLMQFQADLLNARICRPKMIDSTVWGAASLAGVSAKIWSPAKLASMQKQDRVFLPKMPRKKAGQLYLGWQKAIVQVQA